MINTVDLKLMNKYGQTIMRISIGKLSYSGAHHGKTQIRDYEIITDPRPQNTFCQNYRMNSLYSIICACIAIFY